MIITIIFTPEGNKKNNKKKKIKKKKKKIYNVHIVKH